MKQRFILYRRSNGKYYAEDTVTRKQTSLKFQGDDIPMPPYWGGYVLSPMRIEFWQGRPTRLHDRFCYLRLPDKKWRVGRLCP